MVIALTPWRQAALIGLIGMIGLLPITPTAGVNAAFATETRVHFQTGVATNQFTGQVGRYSSGSVGVLASQGLQFGVIGARLTLGTDFHLTNQPPPPYARGLQTFSIATAIRFHLPVRPVEPIIGIEYTNLGVVSNALNRFTGSELSFNAIGANVAARWRFLDPFFVEAQVTARYFVDMATPTGGFGGSLSLGVTGSL